MKKTDITLEKISKPEDQQEKFLVKDGNAILGIISQFKKKPGYTFPWQAFDFHGMYKPNTLINSFYGKNAKEKAIQAVINNH